MSVENTQFLNQGAVGTQPIGFAPDGSINNLIGAYATNILPRWGSPQTDSSDNSAICLTCCPPFSFTQTGAEKDRSKEGS